MAEIPQVSKQGLAGKAVSGGLGIVYRSLRDPEQSGRMAKGLMAGGSAFLRAAGKAAHMLWLEVTGFIFLCFAVIGGFAAIREYRAYTAGTIPAGRSILAICFTTMFAYFGLSSFFRARRRRDS